MCWEDVKIGQATTYRTSYVVVDNVASTILVRPDALRVGLLVCAPSADGIRIQPGLTAVAGLGFLLTLAATFPYEVRLETHGRMVQDQWVALATAAAPVTVMVVELYLTGLGSEVGATRGQ